MKLADVLALVKPFLAADAKPDEIKAAIIAADKGAKDKAAKDKAAKDRKEAYDKARDAMDEEEKKAFDAMPDGEEKDKVAKDKNDDPEHTNDEDIDAEDNELEQAESGTPSKGGKSKSGAAMDAATVDKLISKRVAAAVAARDELHAAIREVEPIVGKRAFDSAGDAYKAALDHMGVDLTGIPASAYRSVLTLAKAAQPKAAPALAVDAVSEADVLKMIPHLNRL